MKRCLAAAFVLLAGDAFAIMPNLASEIDCVGIVSVRRGDRNIDVGSGVAISNRCVLTARHVPGNRFRFPNGDVLVGTRIEHPRADLAIINFGQDLAHFCTPLYDRGANFDGTFVGFGMTGARRADGSGFDLTADSFGTRRQGVNRVRDRIRFRGRGADFIGIEMDIDSGRREDPPAMRDRLGDGEALNGECAASPGDSGGGVFRRVEGAWRLSGIISFGIDQNGNYNPRDADNPTLAELNNLVDFGDTFVAVDISAINVDTQDSYRQWIEANCVPEPASFAVIGGGLAVVLLRRRRK